MLTSIDRYGYTLDIEITPGKPRTTPAEIVSRGARNCPSPNTAQMSSEYLLVSPQIQVWIDKTEMATWHRCRSRAFVPVVFTRGASQAV